MNKDKNIAIYFYIPLQPFLKTVPLHKQEKEFVRMYNVESAVFVNGVFLQSLLYDKICSLNDSFNRVPFYYDLSSNPAVLILRDVPKKIVNKAVQDVNIYLHNRFGLDNIIFTEDSIGKKQNKDEDLVEK